ncbi:MAG TPA: hypothetical protein PK176_02525 [Acidobacteriota bacterium]|nr:hypothetical protein [Acidobacteriota bacterium]HQM62163.1 hypothetical protein [Acidobacteriota bacterium]
MTASTRPAGHASGSAWTRRTLVLLAAGIGALAALGQEEGFRTRQLRYPRVRAAAAARAAVLEQRFDSRGVAYPPRAVYLRVFKEEQLLELWAGAGARGPFAHVADYPFCATSGGPGPKRRQGDGQIPEGFYVIDRFNPASRFHLSLGLDYPNLSDRRLGVPGNLGGDIFIHGGCATIGCIPLTDSGIEEVYLAAVEAIAAGQRAIPVHIYPARLDAEGFDRLAARFAHRSDLLEFWREIRPAFAYFEAHQRIPVIRVDESGHYRIQP